jgi:hypothetical protein
VWCKNNSDTVQNKNLKISPGFFSLQGNPALLVPWMVYTIVFLIGITIIFIYQAVEYFLINEEAYGAASIVAAVIYFCK